MTRALSSPSGDEDAALPAKRLLSLSEFVRLRLDPPHLARIRWGGGDEGDSHPDDVWMTHNFALTTVAPESGAAAKLNWFLRPVGFLCLMRDGHALLLTEREAGALLDLGEWDLNFGLQAGGGAPAAAAAGGAVLMHLSYAEAGSDGLAVCFIGAPAGGAAGSSRPLRRVPAAALCSAAAAAAGEGAAVQHQPLRALTGAQVAKLQLFAGRTTLGAGAARQSAVRALLPEGDRAARDSVLELARTRGLGQLVKRSQLEDICQES